MQGLESGGSSQLVIERTSGRCLCSNNFNPLQHGIARNQLYFVDVFAILGILNVENFSYIAIITSASIIAEIEDSNIYLIKNVELLPIDSNTPTTESLTRQLESLAKVTLYTAPHLWLLFFIHLRSH